MKRGVLLLAVVLVSFLPALAVTIEDGLCSFPEYTHCGTTLPPVTFTLIDTGNHVPMIQADWFGYTANFVDWIYIHDITTGYIGPTSYVNAGGQEYGSPILLTGLGANLHFGDQIEFVVHVNTDPNHPGGIDYCWNLASCYQDYNNGTQIGHVFAENLAVGNCDLPGIACLFMGFEDLPYNEGPDYDYNDFEFYVYGVSINTQNFGNVATPEPGMLVMMGSGVLTLAGALRRRLP